MLRNLNTSRYGRIVQAVWSGSVARVVSCGITLVSLPLAVRYLGAERYGVWATITTTAVWINLLDLGIANTLTNNISRAYALDDKRAAARAFTNALVLTAGMAGVAGLASAMLFPHVNWSRLLNVSPKVSAAEVKYTAAAAVALTLLALPCNLIGKVLAGYQELHRNNYAICAGALGSLCGLGLGIALHVSMPALFVMSVGCMTDASVVMLVLVTAFQKRWLLPRPSLIQVYAMRELLHSGSSFFLIQVAAVIVFSSDNLIVSHYLGASEVTPYSITWRVVGFVALLQSLFFPALWPAYAEAYAKRDYGWIRRTFAITMTGTVTLNLFCVTVLLACGRNLIRLWAGSAAVPTWPLLVAMSIWALVNGFMSVESCLLAALNRIREQAVLSIVAAGLNVVLSVMWVRQIGSLGVIGGTIVSYAVVLVIPQTLIVRRIWTRELERGPRPTSPVAAIPHTAARLLVPRASSTSTAQE